MANAAPLRYRLGLHISPQAIGWAVLPLDANDAPLDVQDFGVRAFADGREPGRLNIPGEPLSLQRRLARSSRRRNDRLKMRKHALLRILTRYRLFPEDRAAQKELESLNPLALRHEALCRPLAPYAIGRALFHLGTHRGIHNFAGLEKEEQTSEFVAGIKALAAELEQTGETLGSFLHRQVQEQKTAHFRSGLNNGHHYFPSRQMVEAEFARIWEAQSAHHPEIMHEEARSAIHQVIFWQRPLKSPPRQHCLLIPADERLLLAMPLAQEFRIRSDIARLRILSPDDYRFQGNALKLRQCLSPEQQQQIYEALRLKNAMKFSAIAKLLGLRADQRLNEEAFESDGLEGDQLAKAMRGSKRSGFSFPEWSSLPIPAQEEIIRLRLAGEKEALQCLLQQRYHFSPEQAEAMLQMKLPAGELLYGHTVVQGILPLMREEGLSTEEALFAAGFYDHALATSSPLSPLGKMPYYGEVLHPHLIPQPQSSDPAVREWGYSGNPTTHIALNQLRKLVNALSRRYGRWPVEICCMLDYAMSKGRKEMEEIARKQAAKVKYETTWRPLIEKQKGSNAPLREDFIRFRLWEELGADPQERRCVYTGEPITEAMLFSGETCIDYILPFARTLDHSLANLLLVTRKAAHLKQQQTPYEAFGGEGYAALWQRVQSLPEMKQWRFLPDAMERFEHRASLRQRKVIGNQQEPLLPAAMVNHLMDAHRFARLCREYLSYGCEGGQSHIWIVNPKTQTELFPLAGFYIHEEMERKERRNDYRYRAEEAILAGIVSPRLLQEVQDRAAQQPAITFESCLPAIQPWEGFSLPLLRERFATMKISHKPDHGSLNQGATTGRLHEETAYGYIGNGERDGYEELVLRIPLYSLKSKEQMAHIRDAALRQRLTALVDAAQGNIAQALQSLVEAPELEGKPNPWKGIRSVRVTLEKTRTSLVMIPRDGKPYKVFQGGSNHHVEIFMPKHGTLAGKWQIEVVKTFDANQKGFIPQWQQQFPDATLIMKLHLNDLVEYEDNGRAVYGRIRSLFSAGQVLLVDPYKAKNEVNEGWAASVVQLQKKKARRLRLSVDGLPV